MKLNLEDPFEAQIAEMVKLNRKKRADYAIDGDPWSNFRNTARAFGSGLDATDAVRFNIVQKMERLRALKENGRPPANESVADTWLDAAIYAVIGLALCKEGEDIDPAPLADLAQAAQPERRKCPADCALCKWARISATGALPHDWKWLYTG